MQSEPPDTLAYYEQHAERFVVATRDVDLAPLHDRFLALVPDGGLILDAGCGSPRHVITLIIDVSGASLTAPGGNHIDDPANARVNVEHRIRAAHISPNPSGRDRQNGAAIGPADRETAQHRIQGRLAGPVNFPTTARIIRDAPEPGRHRRDYPVRCHEIGERLDDAHRAERIRHHQIDERLRRGLRQGFSGAIRNPSTHEQQIDPHVAEPLPKCRDLLGEIVPHRVV